jgi:hypothetical protein
MSNQAAANVIEVERVLAEAHRPAFQAMLLALCGLCLLIDGFDAQAMDYVAPRVIAEWQVAKTALGPVFSASLFGMLLGALGLSVMVGGQPAVNALAGHFYPTALRSTGIGWSLGIGRIGSVIGPLVGGQLIALNWSNAALFHAAAVPVLCSALLVVALAGATRQRSRASEVEPA